ncbi:MAG TPA: GNAT family N-acetyltransferase [Candidatus Limnocylindria bacterium]
MTEPVSVIRPGTLADSRQAFDVFLDAIVDLAARLGAPWDPKPEEMWPRLEPLLGLLAAHAAEWWVAEGGDGRLLGYARSVERGGLFELSEFFVRPGHQSGGVGRELLARAFPAGRGEVRAIIATIDPRAQASYYRSGTAARFPILSLIGPPGARTGGAPLDRALEALAATPDLLPQLLELERNAIEFDRGEEMRWLVEERNGYLYRRAGRSVGYGFLAPRGGIGPVAADDAADLPAILDHLERRAAELGIDEITADVPGPNEAAIRHLLSRGLKFDTFITLLMASRPFGRFDRFIGFAPPFVL